MLQNALGVAIIQSFDVYIQTIAICFQSGAYGIKIEYSTSVIVQSTTL